MQKNIYESKKSKYMQRPKGSKMRYSTFNQFCEFFVEEFLHPTDEGHLQTTQE